MEIRTIGNVRMFGTRILKNAVLIPKEILTESVVGSCYMLKIETKGITNPDEVLNILKDGLEKKFKMTVVYGEVSSNFITLQVTGSPFIWSVVLMFLPQILVVIGVVVGVITAYLLVSSIPTWVYGLGAIALALIFIVPEVVSKKVAK